MLKSQTKYYNQFCGLSVAATPEGLFESLSHPTNLKNAKGLLNCPWRFLFGSSYLMENRHWHTGSFKLTTRGFSKGENPRAKDRRGADRRLER